MLWPKSNIQIKLARDFPNHMHSSTHNVIYSDNLIPSCHQSFHSYHSSIISHLLISYFNRTHYNQLISFFGPPCKPPGIAVVLCSVLLYLRIWLSR
jgi:hypothetical protein